MSRYLITGGAGFIGSNIAHALIARGKSVRILDDFSTGRAHNLEGIADRVEIVRGDLRDPEAVTRAVRGIEIVLHQAALNSNPRSIKEPGPTNAVNVGGTLLLLEAARQAGVRRLVLYHHAPSHSDDQMDRIAADYLAKGAAVGIEVLTSFEGMTIPIGDDSKEPAK